MTEPVAVVPVEPVRVAMLPEQSLPQMLAFAETLVKTGFLPQAIKTPAQAVAVILTGRELGIGPMQALRSINVIQGKPALSAELMLALFKRRGGNAVWKESTDTKAVLWLKHPNGDEHTETFTLEDARRADLLGKSNWKVYPKAMLRARCASAGLRAIAPDVTAGMYDPDELGAEIPPVEVVVAPAKPEVTQPLTEKPAPLAAPEPAMPWERPGDVSPDGEILAPTRDTPCPFVPSKRALKDLAKNQLAFLEEFLTASKEDDAALWLPLVVAERAARSKTT